MNISDPLDCFWIELGQPDNWQSKTKSEAERRHPG